MPYKDPEYMKKYRKRYRQKHGEKIREDKRKYYQEHKEEKKEYNKEYYIKNREKIQKYARLWKLNNKNKVIEYEKRYRFTNKENLKKNYREWQKNKRKTDLKYNLNHKISMQIYMSLKRNKNSRCWEDLVGYALNDLVKHLEKTMPKDYKWADYLEGKLHIDHIIPISVWNFDKPEQINFKHCWALDNLRLLPAKENHLKRDKLLKPFQTSLKI